MPATEEVLLKLTGDPRGATQALDDVKTAWASLGRFLQKGQKTLKGVSTQMARTSKSSVDLAQKFSQVGKAGRFLTIVFGGLAAMGGKLIQSTSRVAMRNEVLALSLYTVGKNAGWGREELDYFTQAVKDLGITTSQARLGLTRMLQGQLDLTQATDLARTAQNLAVIAGENSSETFGNMLEAIVSLQPRMLRQYGIVTTLKQALGDLANSTDATEKRQGMLNYVLEEGARSAGVYEAAMGVVGKRITSIPRLVEEAKASFGKHFLPMIGAGIDMLSRLLKTFQNLPEPVQKFLAMLTMLGTTFATLMASFGGALVMLPLLISGLTALAGVLGVTATTIGGMLLGVLSAVAPYVLAIGAAVGALLVVLTALRSAWEDNWGGIRMAIQHTLDLIGPRIQGIIGMFKEWGKVFGEQARLIWGDVKKILEPIFGRLTRFIRSINWAEMFTTFRDAINVVGNYISALLETIHNLLQGKGLRSFMPLREAMIDVLTLIALVWKKYIARAFLWGYNLILQVARGIVKAAQSVLVAAMNFVGKVIGWFLKPGSAPLRGPLSNIISWAQGVMNTYLRAFATADFGIMNEALAPIQEALESALQAGDISGVEFAQVFQQVRTQVAALISDFRTTGEISESALGSIAETLGEGSEELVQYLRLQLQHQQALEHLADAQQEYSEYERRGAVPLDIKRKLEAAREAAALAEDQVNWQREYLAMQQSSIDLQLRLVQAIEALTAAVSGEAPVAAEEPAAGGAGVGDLGLGGLGDLDLSELQGGAAEMSGIIGEMSAEFLAMRAEIDGMVTSFENWLALPFNEQMAKLAAKLTEITGVDFVGYWEDIERFFAKVDRDGLLVVIIDWLGKGVDWLEENWPEFSEKVEEYIVNALVAAFEALGEKAADWLELFITWYDGILEDFKTWMDTNFGKWGTDWAYNMGRAMGKMLEILTVTIPLWVARLIVWFFKILNGLLNWFIAYAPILGTALWTAFVIALTEWLALMWENLQTWEDELLDYMEELMREFVRGVLENAPDWLANLVQVGYMIVEKIKTGLRQAWGSLMALARRLAAQLAAVWPFSEPKDRRSPLRNLHRAGEAIVNNIASGMDFKPLRDALRSELAGINASLGMGGTSISQTFGDVVFPNVRSGRDALGVRRTLDRRAMEASMMGRTAGAF